MKYSYLSFALALIILTLHFSTFVGAQNAPGVINYQSQFVKPSGDLEDRALDLRFSLWSDADFTSSDLTGTGAVDTGAANYGDFVAEFWNVTPNEEGVINIPLGATTPLPDMDPQVQAYLQVEVRLNDDNGDDTAYELLDPDLDVSVDRRQLSSVPYSFYSDYVGIGTQSDEFKIDANEDAADEIALNFGGVGIFDYSKTNSRFRFNRDVTFQQNQARDFVLHNVTDAATDIGTGTGALAGQMAYDSDDKVVQYYDGTDWVSLATGSGSSGGGESLTSITFNAEWGGSTYYPGSNDSGVFSSHSVRDPEVDGSGGQCGFASADPTDTRSFYCWAGTVPTSNPYQNMELQTNFRLPENFVRFGGDRDLVVEYRTEDSSYGYIDVLGFDDSATAITFSGSSTNISSNNTWEEAALGFSGSFSPGDDLMFNLEFNSKGGYPVMVSRMTLYYYID